MGNNIKLNMIASAKKIGLNLKEKANKKRDKKDLKINEYDKKVKV